jgi:hypothetical protein
MRPFVWLLALSVAAGTLLAPAGGAGAQLLITGNDEKISTRLGPSLLSVSAVVTITTMQDQWSSTYIPAKFGGANLSHVF